MVYPTLIAAISDAAHPAMRARALSVYRFWRDLGYAVGALTSGLIADIFGFEAAILAIAALTFVSGVVAAGLCRSSHDDRKPENGQLPDPPSRRRRE